MPNFNGLVEIQTSPPGPPLATIKLDGNVARVEVGDNGQAGVVSVRTDAGDERVLIDQNGVTVRDSAGQAVVQLVGGSREVFVLNASGQTVLRMEGNTAAIHIGAVGEAGELFVYDSDGRQVLHMDGKFAHLRVGAEGNEGDITVDDAAGRRVFHMDGQYAHLQVGTSGNEGDITVNDAAGRRVFHMDGQNAHLRVGIAGNEGDITLEDGAGRRVFHMDGQFALLTLGASGNEGDLQVLDNNGNITIHLDGNSGDIILQNADTAEEFEVGDDTAAPGMVMVLDDNGKLYCSRGAYDRRVAGIISGAGMYRPGIILGRTPNGGKKLPLALNGRVYCHVDATQAPIAVGDLLTTSPTPGHAMKADDPLQAFGAVIGKALQPLTSGQGLIQVLVALQ